jgi:mannose-6-phosphate isomerase-like protein (cupin superfamily)
MTAQVFRKKDAIHTRKAGVDMHIYTGKDDLPGAAVAYQETERGHAEEFRHTKSDFVFFIVEGAGEWIVDGESLAVEAHDVVVVPKGAAFYYRGKLKLVCITVPAWEAEFEETLRSVPL